MRIVWSPLAIERVEEIARSIAADRPTAAQQWVVALFDRVAQLRRFPESGQVVLELGRSDVRQLLVRPYHVIYRVDPTRIVVLTVRHWRQEPEPNESG